MRYLIATITLVAAGLMALPAVAQPPDSPPPDQRGGRFHDPEVRQRMLAEFDKDGDGSLNDEERQAMRKTMRERFGRGGPGGPPGEPGQDRPPWLHGRPDGHHGPGDGAGHRGRRLEVLFDWFDENEDGMLSRSEFRDLAEFIGRHRPGHQGDRPGRHGPPGRPGVEKGRPPKDSGPPVGPGPDDRPPTEDKSPAEPI